MTNRLSLVSTVNKNFSYLIIAQGIYKILAFLTFIFIARYLGAEAFGRLSYALSFVAFFMLIADFGVSDLMVREVAGERQDKGSRYINNISSLKFSLSLITYAAIILIVLILRETKEMFSIVAILGLAMILDSYTIFLKSIFRVFEKMEYEAMSILLEGILKLGFVLMIVRNISANALLFSQVFLLISIITLIFTVFITRIKFIHLKLCFDFKFWKKLLIGGTPFAILIFFHVINFRIDTVMLSKITNNIITGWYSVAARLIEPILIIPTTFTVAVFPVVSRLAKTSEKSLALIYYTSLKVLFLSSIVLVIILYIGAGFFIPLLFGKEFVKSIPTVRILGFVLIPIFLRFFLDTFVLALNKPNILFINYVIGTSINILMNLILIPKFKIFGCCLATISSELIMVGFCIFWIRKNLPQAIKTKIDSQWLLLNW